MKLTKIQKEAILSATKDVNYCFRFSLRTRETLNRKGLARLTSGFGWLYGGVAELTELGKEIQIKLKQQDIK